MHLDVGGGVEGLAIGAAAGLGYAGATALAEGGLAAPRGRRRAATAAVVGLACAAATLALALAGRALVGGTVHLIAEASQGSQVVLTPLGRLLGEPDFGPVSAAVLGTGEGLLFGVGLGISGPDATTARVGRVVKALHSSAAPVERASHARPTLPTPPTRPDLTQPLTTP